MFLWKAWESNNVLINTLPHSILYGFVTISALKGILNHDILSFVSKTIDLSNYCMFLRLWKAIHVQNMIFRLHWTWNYNIWCMYIVKIWTNLSYLNNKNASCFLGSRFQTFGVGVESRQCKLCVTFFANVNINYRLPIKAYYRICTDRHIRIEIIHGSQNVFWDLT